MLIYHRNTGGNSLAILFELVAKEFQQRHFLIRNAFSEKLPRRVRIGDDAQRITQQHLQTNRPPKPAKVAGMAHVGVEAGGDQHVCLSLLRLGATTTNQLKERLKDSKSRVRTAIW